MTMGLPVGIAINDISYNYSFAASVVIFGCQSTRHTANSSQPNILVTNCIDRVTPVIFHVTVRPTSDSPVGLSVGLPNLVKISQTTAQTLRSLTIVSAAILTLNFDLDLSKVINVSLL